MAALQERRVDALNLECCVRDKNLKTPLLPVKTNTNAPKKEILPRLLARSVRVRFDAVAINSDDDAANHLQKLHDGHRQRNPLGNAAYACLGALFKCTALFTKSHRASAPHSTST